jgi:hypothetical protein
MKRIGETFGVVWCLQDSNPYSSGNGVGTNGHSQERDALALLLLLRGQKVWYHDEKVHSRQGQQVVANVEIESIRHPRSQGSDSAGDQTRSLKVVPWKRLAAAQWSVTIDCIAIY